MQSIDHGAGDWAGAEDVGARDFSAGLDEDVEVGVGDENFVGIGIEKESAGAGAAMATGRGTAGENAGLNAGAECEEDVWIGEDSHIFDELRVVGLEDVERLLRERFAVEGCGIDAAKGQIAVAGVAGEVDAGLIVGKKLFLADELNILHGEILAAGRGGGG